MTQVLRSIDNGPVLATLMPSDTVRRSFDASEINPILNDPSVFPFISFPGDETYDATALVSDPRNVLMMANGGGILFCQQEPGIYEVHTNFLEGHRGRNAVKASLAAYRYMFTHSDCMTLLTRVPVFNKGADLFCRLVGARLEFERAKAWPTKDGLVDLRFYAMRVFDWLWQTPSLAVSGKRFHDRLNEERDRLGKPHPEDHPDDRCHDIAVGMCAEMMFGGQLEKAVILYNSWARFAGFGTISLVSREPAIVDIGTELIQVQDNTFKVILCR